MTRSSSAQDAINHVEAAQQPSPPPRKAINDPSHTAIVNLDTPGRAHNSAGSRANLVVDVGANEPVGAECSVLPPRTRSSTGKRKENETISRPTPTKKAKPAPKSLATIHRDASVAIRDETTLHTVGEKVGADDSTLDGSKTGPADASGESKRSDSSRCLAPTKTPTSNQRSGCTIAELLSMANGSWCLEARVVARGQTSSWVGVWGEGKKFDFYLADKTGEVVKAVMFNKGVDVFDGVVKSGMTFLFSKGRLKNANIAFSAYQVDITFDERAVIEVTAPIPQVTIPCVSIERVPDNPPGSKVSIIGVIAMAGGVRSIVTKKQSVVSKREFLVVDSSMRKVVCTRWGKQADEDMDACVGKVVIVMRADLNEYEDMRSLSLGPSSSVLIDPDVAENASLQKWYGTNQDLSKFTFM